MEEKICLRVCGDFFTGLFNLRMEAIALAVARRHLSMLPSSISLISFLIWMRASQNLDRDSQETVDEGNRNLSSSSLFSDSVGSIIKAPATGQLIVGAWNPKSISRLAMSTASTPQDFLKSRTSMMNS